MARSASDLEIKDADLLVCAATWDLRCLEFSKVTFPDRVTFGVLLDYPDRGRDGIVDRHESEIAERLRLIVGDMARVKVKPTEMVDAWAKVREAVHSVYQAEGRPISVAVDLNSVPRYISLSLMGYALRTGIVRKISFTYAAAHEYVSSDPRSLFTDGSWRPRAIPTLGDAGRSSARSHLVVTAGFEGRHARRLVNTLEPDRVSLALTTGIHDSHDSQARRANVQLAEEYLLGSEDVILLPAADIEGAVRALRRSLALPRESAAGGVAISFLLCGTKLAALAAAIYAMDADVAQLFYAEPERRVEASAVSIEWATLIELET